MAWVEDNGIGRFYIDGQLDIAVLNHTPGSLFLNTIALGGVQRAVAGNFFSGLIDDAALWERPLSQAEIQQVMNNSLDPNVPQFPPFIVSQPASASRGLGNRYTFRVQAIGNRPISYQWFKDDMEIFGATSNTFTLSNLTVSDSGNYTVRIANPSGSVTSVVAVLTVAPDPASDLRTGLLSYWPMETIDVDDMGVNSTPDVYSGNDMRLVTTGFYDQMASPFGAGIFFNGVEQYGVRMGGFPLYNNPALSFSIWVNAGPQADRRFFCESSTNNNNNPLFAFGTHTSAANPSLRVFIRNNTGGLLLDRFSTRPVLDSNWHHVVWVETNGQAKLYIDGQLDGSDYNYTRGPLTVDTTAIAAIVRTNLSPLFTGALGELALWNRMLTFTEIQELRTNGVPAPIMPIAPEVTQQPLSQSVLTRSKVTFSFTATGTSPLEAQWRKNGMPISDETNFTFMVNNVTLGDAGDYDVIVSNTAGRATSDVARLTVTLRPPAPSQLSVDFNNIGQETPADTESGFSSFTIPEFGVGPFTRALGGADVTVLAIGTTMESRKRVTPVNQGDFTQEKLLQDFIFTRDATTDQGMDIAVEFMEPNQPYGVSIWSFDTGSVGANRISDWSANGALVQMGYTFFGSDIPTDNNRYRFTFNTTSDADGKILIQGRRNASASGAINVFINALQINRRDIRIQKIEFAASDTLRLTFEALDPAALHRVDQKINLNDAWSEVQGAFFNEPMGNTIEVLVPVTGAATGFYRVAQVPEP